MNGNLVGARAVTTTLPLLAAIAMDTERLEQAACPRLGPRFASRTPLYIALQRTRLVTRRM